MIILILIILNAFSNPACHKGQAKPVLKFFSIKESDYTILDSIKGNNQIVEIDFKKGSDVYEASELVKQEAESESKIRHFQKSVLIDICNFLKFKQKKFSEESIIVFKQDDFFEGSSKKFQLGIKVKECSELISVLKIKKENLSKDDIATIKRELASSKRLEDSPYFVRLKTISSKKARMRFKKDKAPFPVFLTSEYLSGDIVERIKMKSVSADSVASQMLKMAEDLRGRGLVLTDFGLRNAGLNKRGDLKVLDLGSVTDSRDHSAEEKVEANLALGHPEYIRKVLKGLEIREEDLVLNFRFQLALSLLEIYTKKLHSLGDILAYSKKSRSADREIRMLGFRPSAFSKVEEKKFRAGVANYLSKELDIYGKKGSKIKKVITDLLEIDYDRIKHRNYKKLALKLDLKPEAQKLGRRRRSSLVLTQSLRKIVSNPQLGTIRSFESESTSSSSVDESSDTPYDAPPKAKRSNLGDTMLSVGSPEEEPAINRMQEWGF